MPARRPLGAASKRQIIPYWAELVAQQLGQMQELVYSLLVVVLTQKPGRGGIPP